MCSFDFNKSVAKRVLIKLEIFYIQVVFMHHNISNLFSYFPTVSGSLSRIALKRVALAFDNRKLLCPH